MYRIFCCLICLFSISLNAQTTDVVSWLNANAIVIEDASQNTELAAFAQNEPQGFKEAKIYGFGEATHHTKEFFDLKAKFFKYLVEHNGVRVFIMEESYQAEQAINEWISGGPGDKASVVKNFRHFLWRNTEVADLLEWMRNYNQGKPRKLQIRFYGIDNQMGDDINKRLRSYVQKYNIKIDENLLAAADSCSAAEYGHVKIKEWGKKMQPKLQQLTQLLEQDSLRLKAVNANEYIDMKRGLGYLEDYTAYISWPATDVRDNAMYENVLKIMNLEAPGSKAFVWAHNEHINKKDFGTIVPSLGSRLKEHFKNDYYATGFDFGSGKMLGFVIKKKQVLGSEYRILDKPYKKTYAETFFQAQPDIYFVDIATAVKNPEMKKFFGTKMKQLFIGGPGFDPKDPKFFSRKCEEAYDGIIFLKNISPSVPQKQP